MVINHNLKLYVIFYCFMNNFLIPWNISAAGCMNPSVEKQPQSHAIGAQARPLVQSLQACVQECVTDDKCDSVDWK